jgi:choline dehydrogenase-like flavoprotein
MIVTGLPECCESRCPVVVVGAGPAGIVQALELRRHGVEVLMLAGGMDGFRADFQALADADIADPRRHAPMAMAVRRGLGGTSSLWGGRCVPFDEVDFADRDHVRFGGWPLGAAAIRPWYDIAARYLDCGPPEFVEPPDFVEPGAFGGNAECRLDRLERWSEARDLRRLHATALENDLGLAVCLGVVATGIDIDPESGRATGITVALPSGGRATLRGRAIVLACGGLETTRLMLAAQRAQPRLFGGEGGPLGRFYMGHLEGGIADVVLAQPGLDRALDFHVDANRRYVRRRITVTGEAQQRHGLLNLAAWPDNPALGDPAHRSAILSLAYLSLATPGLGGVLAPDAIRRKHLADGVGKLGPHLENIARGLPEAAREAGKFLWGRYAANPRLPGFFIANKARRYAFFYHAEQAPNPDSRVRLNGADDALGMPRLKIDLRYGEQDARSVAQSHAIIDRFLREAELGRLDYTVPEAERETAILDQATDGYHQTGTTRMAARAKDGVVDPDCRVHGAPNLFVASSSVFPTSGQANPTLMLAAFSARLAEHLAQQLSELPN